MNPNSGDLVANIQKLKESQVLRYYSENYPSFIVYLPRVIEEKDTNFLILPQSFISAVPHKIPSTIILQIPNGHETHVRSKKSEQSLLHMKEFKMVCRGLIGSIMIFSYLAQGKFMVNFLKDDMGEVIYHLNRTIPRGIVYDQDLTNAFGWKFLVYLNTDEAEEGEVAIPRSFWRMFGSLLPENIHFYLRNGTMYTGTCSPNDRRMVGLSDFIARYGLSRSEKLLLTYFGEGNFFIMVFDDHDVKVMLLQDSIDDSGYIGNYDTSDMIDVTVDDNIENVAAELNDAEIIHDQNEFARIMTACNVNNSSHGPYIPKEIHPVGRPLVAGDQVFLRTEHDDWPMLIVLSTDRPRFSRGWNQFCRDNNIGLNETLVFTLLPDDDLVFSVNFPGRN